MQRGAHAGGGAAPGIRSGQGQGKAASRLARAETDSFDSVPARRRDGSTEARLPSDSIPLVANVEARALYANLSSTHPHDQPTHLPPSPYRRWKCHTRHGSRVAACSPAAYQRPRAYFLSCTRCSAALMLCRRTSRWSRSRPSTQPRGRSSARPSPPRPATRPTPSDRHRQPFRSRPPERCGPSAGSGPRWLKETPG